MTAGSILYGSLRMLAIVRSVDSVVTGLTKNVGETITGSERTLASASGRKRMVRSPVAARAADGYGEVARDTVDGVPHAGRLAPKVKGLVI